MSAPGSELPPASARAPNRLPQGVWNEDDGFLLTDPVIHTGEGLRPVGRRPGGGRGANGKTDKGAAGIRLFFESHACNALCRRLGLRPVARGSVQSPPAGRPPGAARARGSRSKSSA